jgi:hypothetical protein
MFLSDLLPLCSHFPISSRLYNGEYPKVFWHLQRTFADTYDTRKKNSALALLLMPVSLPYFFLKFWLLYVVLLEGNKPQEKRKNTISVSAGPIFVTLVI